MTRVNNDDDAGSSVEDPEPRLETETAATADPTPANGNGSADLKEFTRELLKFGSNFYWLAIPETVAETLWHCGVSLESLFGINTHSFFIPDTSHWCGSPVNRLLAQQGITIFAEEFLGDYFVFRVAKEEAARTQAILLANQVPLSLFLIDKGEATQPTVSASSSQFSNSDGGEVSLLDSHARMSTGYAGV